jgi:hypothetical protein
MKTGCNQKRFRGSEGADQPINSCGLLARPVTDCTPAPAVRDQFPKGWRGEWLRRAVRWCESIESARARGVSVAKMSRRIAGYWRNRHYHCDPRRPVLCSARSIRRIYFAWRKGGRTTAAIEPKPANNSRCVEFTLSTGERMRVRHLLLDGRTVSFSQIFTSLFPRQAPICLTQFYRKIPAAVRARARKIFRSRQALARAERALAVALHAGGFR